MFAEIHKRLNNNQISMECNRKEETEGSIKMKVYILNYVASYSDNYGDYSV